MRARVVASLALVAAMACRDEPLVPAGRPYLSGRITSGDSSQFLLEGAPGSGREAKAVFGVTRETTIAWRDGRAATRDDLRVGRAASLWITGVVRESYPVQVDARTVILEPDSPAAR